MRGWRDRRGNVSVLMAGSLVMLIATSALGVDTASLFLEKRRLQGVADAAAIAAADDPAAGLAAAEAAVALSPRGEARVLSVEAGRYDADPAVPFARRFVAGTTGPNAARVAIEGGVVTIFGRALGLAPRVPITASATAARIDSAAISIGSRLAALDGGLPNAVLSGLAGSELHLSAMDYTALAASEVDLLTWVEALRSRGSIDVATFGEVLDADISLPLAIEAIADATAGSGAAAALRALAHRLPARLVRLRDVIDLGPLTSAAAADPGRPIRIGTMTLLREAILIGGEARTAHVTLSPGLPGLAATRLRLEIGERPARSPWLAVGRGGTVTVRTAQARLSLDATLLGAAPLGLGTIRLPLVVELAEGQASLTDVDCSRATGRAATLGVLPSVGQVAIAGYDDAAFSTFSTPLTLQPARIIGSPLGSVTAYSAVRLGGSLPQTVRFTEGEVAAGAVKSVATSGIVGGVAASLVRDVDIRVSLLGLGLSTSLVTSGVGTVLAGAAPSLDGVLDGVTALAGLRVGQADVWVNALRCGVPVLVG